MNLRQFEIFCAVMRCRTMQSAAFELGVSQPAVSNAIKHMETRMGIQLFERTGNRLVPTVEAKALFHDAEPLQAMSQALGRKILDLRDAKRGHFRVLSTQAASRSIVAKSLATFMRARENVYLFFDVRRMEGVVESVETGFADIGVALAPAVRPGLVIEPLVTGRMIVILPPHHALTSRQVLRPADLKSETMIGLEPASRLGSLVRQSFDQAGCEYLPTIEVRHCVNACSLVHHGLGVAIVDEFSFIDGGWRIEHRKFEPEIPVSVSAMYLKDRPLSRLASRFIAEMRKTKWPPKKPV